MVNAVMPRQAEQLRRCQLWDVEIDYLDRFTYFDVNSRVAVSWSIALHSHVEHVHVWKSNAAAGFFIPDLIFHLFLLSKLLSGWLSFWVSSGGTPVLSDVANPLIRSATVKTKDFIIVIDGIFGMHTKKADLLGKPYRMALMPWGYGWILCTYNDI